MKAPYVNESIPHTCRKITSQTASLLRPTIGAVFPLLPGAPMPSRPLTRRFIWRLDLAALAEIREVQADPTLRPCLAESLDQAQPGRMVYAAEVCERLGLGSGEGRRVDIHRRDTK